MKRIISLVLSLSIMMSLFSGMNLTVFAEESEKIDYSYLSPNQYMSKVILNNNYNGVLNDYGNDHQTPQQYLYEALYYNPENASSARVIYNEFKDANDIKTLQGLYELLTFNPSNLANDVMKLEDYYTAILLSIIDSKISDDNFVDDLNCKANKNLLTISKNIAKILEGTAGAENVDFSKISFNDLSVEECQQITEICINDAYSKDLWNKVGKDIGIVSNILYAADNLNDAIKNINNYSSLATVNAATEAVLQEIYNNCPEDNLPMKNAAKKVYEYVSEKMSNEILTMIELGEATFDVGYKILVSKFWSSCLTAVLGELAIGVLIGQAIGGLISNYCFATDAVNEQLVVIGCIVDFEDVMVSAVNSIAETYKVDESEENADSYMRSLQLLLSTYDLGCDYLLDFIELAYTGGVISNIKYGDSDSLAYWRTAVPSRQNSIRWETLSFLSYANFYKVDAPSAYELYFGSEIDGELVEITGMEITQIAPMIVGDEGAAYNFFEITYLPEDHTGSVLGETVVSSDESIIKVDNSQYIGGYIEAVGQGSCTLTFTSYTGDITADIEVTVGINENILQIGEYPQTKVVNTALIDELNSLDLEWTSYDYYIGDGTVASISSTVANNSSDWNEFATMSSSDYAKYTDVTYNGDKYRGVLFSSYRPSNTFKNSSSDNSYQDDNGYYTGTVYWFKYEPITWIIIDEENNIAVSEKILDSQAYNNVIINITNFGAYTGSKSHANNYSASTVLSWLKGSFYESAFTTPKSQSMISRISSSGVSSKIALLGFDTMLLNDEDSNAVGYGTDYAKSQGLRVYSENGSSNWRICDDGSGYYGRTYYYNYEGALTYNYDQRDSTGGNLTNTSYGVRPVIKINETYSYTITQDNVTYNVVNNEYCVVKKVNNNPESVSVLKYVDGVRVTSIADEAFKDCTNLKSVTIPSGVTTIGKSAFRGCSSLLTISIPNSVEVIEGYTFYGCKSLTTISLPNQLTSISDYAFYGCTLLTDISLPGKLTSIGKYSFYGCSSLTEVILPNNVTSIDKCTFYDCSSLKYISIPSRVTSIGDSAFRGCCSLKTIEIPNKVTTIEDYTFYNCDSLSEIVLPDTVSSIGAYAFYSCDLLGKVSLTNTITSIGNYTFYRCSSLTEITLPTNITSIGEGTFSGCSALTSIVVPNGVTYISVRAFADCSNLSCVTIPNSVITLDKFVFEGCGLTRINYTGTIDQWVGIDIIPGYKNPFGNECNLYINDQMVTEVNITCATNIKPYVFSQFKNIKKVVLSDTVETIGRSSFDGCSSLEEITLGSGLKSIGYFAFDECSNLVKTNYTGTINQWVEVVFETYYGSYAEATNPVGISNCLYINNEIVTDAEITTATQINDYAFINCTSLESVNIGNRVTSIGDDAFRNCTSLTNVTIGDSVTSIGDYAFYNCDSLTSVTIPDSVTSIGGSAFYGCTSLTSITIPNSITSIGSSAFSGCNNLVIRCSIGSYAAEYAANNSIPYEYTDKAISISVNTMPTKTVYPIDGMLDVTGLVLDVLLDTGDTKTITAGYTIGDYDFSGGGEKVITVSVCNCSTTFTVTVDPTLIVYPESDHPYVNNTNKTWSFTYPTDASSLKITFSSETQTESGYDYIYIYDGEGNQIGKYSGTSLANVTVEVPGNTFSIKLTSDGSVSYYGFTITNIEPVCDHIFTTYTSDENATCISYGTKTAYCDNGCGATDTIEDPDSGYGEHSFGEWTTTVEPTGVSAGEKSRQCTVCDTVETEILEKLIPEIIVTNYDISITVASDIKDMRYAPGEYTTTAEIKAAEGNVALSNTLVQKYTTDGAFNYEMPNGGYYTIWIRMTDGTNYILPLDVTNFTPTVSANGVTVTLHDLYDVKDFFIAKGEYNTYREIKDNGYIFSATDAKIAGKHDYTCTVHEPGVHTILIRYNDGTQALFHETLTVDEPVFTTNGLQVTIGNIPDVKVIRTAYGEWSTTNELKATDTIRNFSAKSVIKGAEEYKIQYRNEGIVTIIVEYNNGYVKVFHYDVQQKEPTVEQNGNKVTFGNLDGLNVIRYAEGEYTTAAQIKSASGSKALKASSIVDGYITVTLDPGTYSFCVQYNDESFNYYTIVVK